jgi:outer membrane receptor for ferrienterochelin and colicins
VPESLGQIRFTHNGRWFDTFVNLKITGPMDIPRINVDPATGDTTSNELRESPWFFNMDVGFRKTFELKNANLLTLDLGVRNLFNDFQDDLQEGAFRDADYIYGPAFPRTIYAGLSYEFYTTAHEDLWIQGPPASRRLASSFPASRPARRQCSLNLSNAQIHKS